MLAQSLGSWLYAFFVMGMVLLMARAPHGARLPMRVPPLTFSNIASGLLADGTAAFLLARRFHPSRIQGRGVAAASAGSLVGLLSALFRTILSLADQAWRGLLGNPLSWAWLLAVGTLWRGCFLLLIGAAAGWALSRSPIQWKEEA